VTSMFAAVTDDGGVVVDATVGAGCGDKADDVHWC